MRTGADPPDQHEQITPTDCAIWAFTGKDLPPIVTRFLPDCSLRQSLFPLPRRFSQVTDMDPHHGSLSRTGYPYYDAETQAMHQRHIEATSQGPWSQLLRGVPTSAAGLVHRDRRKRARI